MNAKKLSLCLLAAFLGGCLPVMSLHSLYTDSDIVFEEKLLGTWIEDSNDNETSWVFERMKEQENIYELTLSDEGKKLGSFAACIVKLQDKLFLDLFPIKMPGVSEDPNKTDLPYNSLFFIPAHTFLKVESIAPQLKMKLTTESKMKELLEKEPDIVKHTIIQEEKLILTAPTKELQEFVLKYADDDRVFTDEIVLNRKNNQDSETKETENKQQ